MSKSLTKYERAIVNGSVGQIAKQQGRSLADALFDVDAVDYIDTSGSMMTDINGFYSARDGKSRHDVALDELQRLQDEFPGKIAVYSWSSGQEPEFCPTGVPYRFNKGTEMREALEHMKRWDDTGVALYLTSDGYPDYPHDSYDLMPSQAERAAEERVLEVARTFKSPINTIFIGGEEDSKARDFMRRLAEATGGRFANTTEVAKLYDPTKKFMLMDGIKPDHQEPADSNPIAL